VDQSAQASGHASAAIAAGVGQVLAVPLIVTGRVLSITGAALADVGAASINPTKK
jgi:hypothetical protein